MFFLPANRSASPNSSSGQLLTNTKGAPPSVFEGGSFFFFLFPSGGWANVSPRNFRGGLPFRVWFVKRWALPSARSDLIGALLLCDFSIPYAPSKCFVVIFSSQPWQAMSFLGRLCPGICCSAVVCQSLLWDSVRRSTRKYPSPYQRSTNCDLPACSPPETDAQTKRFLLLGKAIGSSLKT